jgi:peroxiredoxin
MRQLYPISLIFATILLLQACTLSSQNTKLSIAGKLLMDTAYTTIFLEDYNKKPQVIASSPIGNDGTFKFNLESKGLDFLKLKLSEKNYIALIVLPGEKITITSTASKIYHEPVITGSPNTSMLFTLSNEVRKYDEQVDSLYRYHKTLKENHNARDSAELKVLEGKLQMLDRERKEYIRQFADKNPHSPANLYYLNRLDIKENLSTFIKVDDTLFALYPENPFVIELNYTVSTEKYVQPGMPAPEISLPSPDGTIINLSSLRGNIVLIDFWASWCGPCRRENPNVVRVYHKYHDKGFEVFGISLDSDRNGWIKAIEKDSLMWIQVSDLKRFNSVAAKTYAVRAIPYSVLIDRDGKIIASALRGSDLAARLQELFGY